MFYFCRSLFEEGRSIFPIEGSSFGIRKLVGDDNSFTGVYEIFDESETFLYDFFLLSFFCFLILWICCPFFINMLSFASAKNLFFFFLFFSVLYLLFCFSLFSSGLNLFQLFLFAILILLQCIIGIIGVFKVLQSL